MSSFSTPHPNPPPQGERDCSFRSSDGAAACVPAPSTLIALVVVGHGLAGLFIGSIFTPWAVVVGSIPLTIALIGWFWPKSSDVPPEPVVE